MTERTVSVVALLGALAHEEQVLKQLGAFAQADGIRTAITRLLRLADEEREQSPPLPKQPLKASIQDGKDA